jgi:signal transduction histidine kinase
MIIISCGILAVYIGAPDSIISQLLIVDIAVLTIYLVVPTRFTYQIIPAAILSIGEILLLIAISSQMSTGLLASVFSIFFANLFGAFISIQLHAYRWKVFQDYKTIKESERLITIGQTAGMVGHDIRNPLQAMTSDIYLMKEEITSSHVSKSKESLMESLVSLDDNISYINKIVQDLQDYARPITPDYSNADLSNVLVKVFENVRVSESIKLSIKVKDLENLRTDPMLLQRALSNLVTNAIQAMADGGILEITGHPEQNKVVITVSDTGVGIPDEIKPKLFTPMMTTKSKGQGFGLAVSKRLIEAMKGTISFESEEGKGTKFIIELPTAG